ncbi:MAG TPA: HNH endonuclease, partial [Acidimicrobiales bacterium]|nr:HNH endonuclease [Acidimicrobiales bacterium]
PAERTQVILHLDLDRETPPRLHLGPAVPGWMGEFLSCDATCRYLLWQDGNPVAMGRREHTVNPRLRVFIEHRDGGCRVPGCDYSRWLHVHHKVHWEHGGPTDPDNLLCLCPVHHRMVHKGLLTIDGDPTDPNGLVFTDNRGRRLTPAHPRPPGPGDPRPAGDWRHPPGERLDPYWISWN